MKTGAIILAAKRGKQDSTFLPLLELDHVSVIRRVILALKRAGISPITVITGEEADQVEKEISGLQTICLYSPEYETLSMFDQICTGLNYMEDLCDSVFILPAKYPILLSETLGRMLSQSAPCVRPVFEGHRGHPILLRKELFPEILTYTGENGLRGALRQPSVVSRTAEVEVSDSGIILSADTMDSDAKHRSRTETLPIYAIGEFQLCQQTPFFTSETARFLMLIEHTGSMQTACRHMQISYSKGWKTMKAVETHLGFPLLHTRTGGGGGGSSSLTKEGKAFLQNYLLAEEQLSAYASELFQKIFLRESKKECEWQ